MITNYSQLKTSIEDWSHRRDLGSRVEEFIQLAEARIRNDLILKPIERAFHGFMNGPLIQPPPDVEQLQKLIYYGTQGEERIVEYSATQPILGLVSAAMPRYFTQQDQVLMLYPTPNAAFRFSLYYVPKLIALSDATPTNWLLSKSPDVYLYGALMHCAIWKKADAEAASFIGMYEKCLNAARNSAERYRMATASSMRMKINSRRVV